MNILPSHRGKKGAALIIVLSFLLIVIVLTITISTTAVLERRSSNVAGTVMQTDMLVRTVENLVQSQIRAATTLSTTNSWSSQPGMIRNYDISGNLSAAYKLYSAANQLVPSAADLQTELTRESSLAASLAFTNSPALYEDLNRPLIFAPPGRTNITYPIADPRALGMVDGFFWNASASVTGTNTTPLTSSFTLNATATNLPVIPMPVQWIYVLKDGTLVAPDPTASGSGRKVTLAGASTTNPVVGRIAYWTDDESCKLNVNTAADGASRNGFWDTPRTGSASYYTPPDLHVDGTYAIYQPNANEFQRYPGHPATTSLRPVFANYLASPTHNPASSSSFTNADYTKPSYNASSDNNLRQALVQMNPRYRELNDSGNQVGSRGGTASGSLIAITNKLSRLYSSIDELNFNTNRTPNTAVPSSSDTTFTLPPAILEQTRFFTTASSRAPEVNLFNLPRVSIWPVHSITNSSATTSQRRSVSDQLNIFCTSLTTNAPWNFTINSNSPVYTFTRNSPTNTSELTSSASGLSRNPVLYNYLYTLMSRPIPGFGGSSGTDTFATKYGTNSVTGDMPQILTEMSDYIRSCVNIGQSTGVSNSFAVNNTGAGGFGIGLVLPSIVTTNNTAGFGRTMHILSEVALCIVGQQTNNSTNTGYTARSQVILNIATVSQGPLNMIPRTRITATGLENLIVTPDVNESTRTNSLFPIASYTVWNIATGQTYSAHFMHPNLDPRAGSGNWLGNTFYPTNSTNPFLFVGSDTFTGVPVTNLPTSYRFSVRQTGPVSIRVEDSTFTNIGTTYNLNFPTFTNTYPLPLGRNVAGNSNNTAQDSRRLWSNTNNPSAPENNTLTLESRAFRLSGNYFATLNPHDNDVVKSLIPMGPIVSGGTYINGDLRLLATQTNVDTNVFLPNRNYFSSATNMGGRSHSLRAGSGGGVNVPSSTLGAGSGSGNGRFGRLAFRNDTNYFNDASPNSDFKNYRSTPAIPSIRYNQDGTTNNMNGVSNSLGYPGDFDTGNGAVSDGPWINKADEGDMINYLSWTRGNANPYFQLANSSKFITNTTLFSPNRQIASAIQFGSLPTGVKSGRPWETLLFCPNPAALTNDLCGRFPFLSSTSPNFHRGFGSPPDYLLLDLFWMPVVEPYAISDPLSTAGKVNLNQNLIPFSTIRRESSLRGLLAGTRIAAFPIDNELWIKANCGLGSAGGWVWSPVNIVPGGYNYRYPINLDKTMDEINAYIGTNGSFKSATEICGIYLIPQRITTGNMWQNPVATTSITSGADITSRFWATNGLTGDNLRERPYNSIYPRLTTQSNVYQVHYTVQTLKKTPASDPAAWDVDKDVILGEQRGSITMERYIDPRDSEFRAPAYDFATRAATSWPPPTLGRFYKFRTVNTRQFR